jgi:hypothetical protein
MCVVGVALLIVGAGDQASCLIPPCPEPDGSTPLRLTGVALLIGGVALGVTGALLAWRRARDRP